VGQALQTVIAISEALEAAHARGIVHRDLKPSNVVISPRGHVKVMDFGLARTTARGGRDDEAASASAYSTRDGVILGTAAYMSPELARGQAVDARADVWALGCVLYEALTGRRAFAGRTISDTLAAVLEREVDWTALPASTPAEVRGLLDRCLRKDRERRLRDVGDVRIELEDAVRAAARTGPEPAGPRPWRKALLPGAALALAVAVGWGLWPGRDAAPPVEKSVAVLPLVTLGDGEGGEDDEYFSTGLTEDIVTHLTRIPELEVASSRSSLRYRDTDKTLREIGEELGVATLLMGTVRRQSDRVRVNVELIDARTSRNLWADVLEGRLSDIFAIQNEIAQRLAGRLELELSAEAVAALEEAPTVDSEAYELVLRGRSLRNRETRESLVEAAARFREALSRDPRYARAWAGLAEVYFLRAFICHTRDESPVALFEDAGHAVRRALELDDELAEARVVNGILLAHGPARDLAGGERELRRAIELNPRHANAHRELGILLLRSRGRVQEAIEAFRKADELEPFWWGVQAHLIEAYLARGDLLKASATSRRAEDAAGRGDDFLLWTTAALQDYEAAERLVSSAADSLDRPASTILGTALILALEGHAAEAERLVDRLLRSRVTTMGFADSLHATAGVVALLREDYEGAVRHLERAYAHAHDPVGWGGWTYPELFMDHATLLGYGLLKTGAADRAHRLFEETERHYMDRIAGGDTTIRARVGIAAVHAQRGDREAAYRWLEQAIDAGFYQYTELERHPLFESLRDEERFQDMMAAVAVRVEEMRRQVQAGEAARP
jgi:TolB-like protein/Flp pilus assembly protein TadD